MSSHNDRQGRQGGRCSRSQATLAAEYGKDPRCCCAVLSASLPRGSVVLFRNCNISCEAHSGGMA
jgi:hypothetical protein